MKWIFIFLFPVLVSAQTFTNDTTYQMVYYQKSLIKKGKISENVGLELIEEKELEEANNIINELMSSKNLSE